MQISVSSFCILNVFAYLIEIPRARHGVFWINAPFSTLHVLFLRNTRASSPLVASPPCVRGTSHLMANLRSTRVISIPSLSDAIPEIPVILSNYLCCASRSWSYWVFPSLAEP